MLCSQYISPKFCEYSSLMYLKVRVCVMGFVYVWRDIGCSQESVRIDNDLLVVLLIFSEKTGADAL